MPDDSPAFARLADTAAIRTGIRFVRARGLNPTVEVPPVGRGDVVRDGFYDWAEVDVASIREEADGLDLDRHGVALGRHAFAAARPDESEDAAARYRTEVEAVVRDALGAARVIAFDHNIRRAAPGAADSAGARAPVQIAHNDYTLTSGPRRSAEILAEAGLPEPGGRYALVNLWRPLSGPVRDSHLAVLDAATLDPDDLATTRLVYPERVGEIYELVHNRAQRWLHVPEMTADEHLLIKGYDSRADGVARVAPHTAVRDPHAPADAPPRESIEVRTLVLYDT